MFALSKAPAPTVRLGFGLGDSVGAAVPPGKMTEAAARAAGFEAELRQLNLRNARLGAWIVMVLLPLCALLDWLTYPGLFWQFLVLRLAGAACCIPLLLALDDPSAGRYHRLYPVVLPVLPAVIVSLMIYLSGDPASPYYAGLCLCLTGASFVFHWTFREIGITTGVIAAAYLAATLPNLGSGTGPATVGSFASNSLFVALTCVILYLGSRHHHAIRRREFDNRWELEAQRRQLGRRNEELTSTIERLRNTEAQLTQSEKLASIGRLSAGIIHEINNPLNFLKMAAHVLQEKSRAMPLDLGHSITGVATDISTGVDRVGAIVSDLRSFAHPECYHLRAVLIEEAVNGALELLASKIAAAGTDVGSQVPPGLTVLGEEHDLRRVVLNLVQNCLDALAGRPCPEIRLRASVSGSLVHLSVRDNGPGIAAGDLQHIFDPFFTTRDVGQGMGLGLSLCYRLMQRMGGQIDLHSDGASYTEACLTFRRPPAPDA